MKVKIQGKIRQSPFVTWFHKNPASGFQSFFAQRVLFHKSIHSSKRMLYYVVLFFFGIFSRANLNPKPHVTRAMLKLTKHKVLLGIKTCLVTCLSGNAEKGVGEPFNHLISSPAPPTLTLSIFNYISWTKLILATGHFAHKTTKKNKSLRIYALPLRQPQ